LDWRRASFGKSSKINLPVKAPINTSWMYLKLSLKWPEHQILGVSYFMSSYRLSFLVFMSVRGDENYYVRIFFLYKSCSFVFRLSSTFTVRLFFSFLAEECQVPEDLPLFLKSVAGKASERSSFIHLRPSTTFCSKIENSYI
jgi:hypothetical protein